MERSESDGEVGRKNAPMNGVMAAWKATLREGKEDLLESGVGRIGETSEGAKFGQRAHAHDAAAPSSSRFTNWWMPPACATAWCSSAAAARRDGAQERHDVAGLAKIEAVEGFVQQQQGLRRNQPESQQDTLGFALGERADARAEERLEFEISCNCGGEGGAFAWRTPVERFEEGELSLIHI